MERGHTAKTKLAGSAVGLQQALTARQHAVHVNLVRFHLQSVAAFQMTNGKKIRLFPMSILEQLSHSSKKNKAGLCGDKLRSHCLCFNRGFLPLKFVSGPTNAYLHKQACDFP